MLRGSHKALHGKNKILSKVKNAYREKPLSKILGLLGISIFVGVFIFWALFLRGIPSLEGLESGNFFRESTVIYDAEGNEIYSLFKDGKRTYIPYDSISQPIKDAIISIEDQSFFENPGIDFMGLMRVAATHLTGGKFGRVGGASTISQQLIKNTLLTNEVSIKRKIQEAYLSYKMNNNYTKEKILEMYLNAIPFGYNANGIEQASRTFFGKSASEVGPLGAVILASLPNGPTKFSPYLHRDRLMGKIEIYPKNDPTSKQEIRNAEERKKYGTLYSEFKGYLSGMTLQKTGDELEICNVKEEYMKEARFDVSGKGCANISSKEVINFFANITIPKNIETEDGEEKYIIEYTIGRKDLVASRMLEDGKIDGSTFQKILYDGLEFDFKKYTESIRYPHFVMYVKEYLESKYGKDIDITSGLKVYTTINPKLQDKAEELVKKQVPLNKSKGASNAALVSMDNKSGELLAMVGGYDYFDLENGGNNNMATSNSIRPGSSFKPFVYALAISKNPIGPESPVADTKTKFASWEPDNYDGNFNGIMTVKSALGFSRNIPAAKMFFLAGGEESIVKFGKNMGMGTLNENGEYGGPLALGSAEVRPIDLMQGYSVLANNGIKRSVYAIKKIEDSEGNILEEHSSAGKENEAPIISPAASYIVSKILADNNARPESSFWRNALTINGRTVAAKTGTADMKTKNGTKLPRDLWTAGYTPQITTVVWAGNVDGTATKGSCDGLNCAAPIWKGFMEFALKPLPKEEFQKPKDIYTYNIVKTSGKLATKNTPESQIVSTIMAVKLDEYDDGQKEVQVDTLCNGPVSENTPPDAIATLYIPSSKPIIDGYDPEWTSGFFAAIRKQGTGTGGTDGNSPTLSETPCERPEREGNVSISIELIGITSTSTTSGKRTVEIGYSGDRPIKNLKLSSDSKLIREISYGTGSKNNGKERIALDLESGENMISVEISDIYGFSYTNGRSILVGSENPSETGISPAGLPKITLTNPKFSTLNLYQGDPFNLRFRVEVGTAGREVQVLLDGKTIHTATSGESFVIPMTSETLSPGNHRVKVYVIDGNFQSAESGFTLYIMPR